LGGSTEPVSAGRNAQTTEHTLASRSGFVNIGDSRGGAIVGSFGAAVAAGDFNNDGFADLAAGAPGDNVG
jgi:FG-GAP repeat